MTYAKKNFILIFIFLLISGCSGKWERNRYDATSFTSADSLCQNRSDKIFPIKNEVAQRTDYEYYEKKCERKSDCNGKESIKDERPVTKSFVIDVNKDSRKHLYNECMSANGWEKHFF